MSHRHKIFTFFEDLEKRFNEAQGYDPVPRDLTDEDYDDWRAAQDAGMIPMRNRAQVVAAIRARNPVRWRQMQKDLKWVQKEMKRLGLNPEDARYII